MLGLWMGICYWSERFSELQSSMNCVKIGGGGVCCNKRQEGCTWSTVLTSSGYSLLLTSDMAMQETKICSIMSTGALQSKQAGLMEGFWIERVSLHRKSHVRNFKRRRSFLTSWVVNMLGRTTWRRPDRTLKYFILEFMTESSRSCHSCQTVTLVLKRVFQSSLDTVLNLSWSRESGEGKLYLIQRSWMWLD